MAVLNEEQRFNLWAEFMRDFPHDETFGNLTKHDIRDAVDALDTFFSNNAATINSAIPQPARAELSAKQKALLLIHVIKNRYVLEA